MLEKIYMADLICVYQHPDISKTWIHTFRAYTIDATMTDGTESVGSAVDEKSLTKIDIANASHPVRWFSMPNCTPEYKQPQSIIIVFQIPHKSIPYDLVHSANGSCEAMLRIMAMLYTRK